MHQSFINAQLSVGFDHHTVGQFARLVRFGRLRLDHRDEGGLPGSGWIASTRDSAIDQDELHSTQEQVDAMAVQVTASLFRFKVEAGLSSTDGRSHSITAKPHRDQHSGRLHLTYVYEQTSPNPAITDEERHMGAADLTIDPDNLDVAEGVYWTRRVWQIGLNTAGRLELHRSTQRKEKGKSLRQYAAEEKKRLEADS